ncbi:MAG: class SAM-dependent methyltransferase [Verrucomicrobiales bacterium]|nr:class SAM-dependent methyltransferase [Verrucomicrobiales bacterium]MDB6129576.1 class SAM-dependent methyltransferase [Verrucomicrobiales bacterium]
MNRIVLPELLDELPPQDPHAIRSRQDLLRVNGWMGNASRLASAISDGNRKPPRNIVELGAGDGRTSLRVAALTGWTNVSLTMVDQQNLLTESTRRSFENLGWKVKVSQQDVTRFLADTPPPDLILTNLFLHHFKPPELARLLAMVAECRCAFAACEPFRDPLALAATRLLWLIGCNHVTRHDAFVSVQAGFRDNEISASWNSNNNWRLTEKRSGLFSHLFLAEPV